ncbi:MAG: acetate--CoA ligase family protein, partial [Acidobacteria bacterium]|nr:acetate--CoA ligase family protein [Acidobacteriota bacterium]
MKIHEYQAKAILARHGVPVPQGEVVRSASEAREAARRLGGGVVVVKAQIHAGGRGKGGGVKVVKNPEDAEVAAGAIIGMQLVTHQTGPEGQTVKTVLVEQGLKIARELYLGMVIDRSTERPVLMVSSEGGVEIEKVAEVTPEKIFKEFVHPTAGLSAFQTRKLAFALGLEGPAVSQAGT